MDTFAIMMGAIIILFHVIFRKRRKERAKLEPLYKISPHLEKIENFRDHFGIVFGIIFLVIGIISTCNK